MKKSLLLFFLFVGLFFKVSYSQAPLAASNPNFLHDKLVDMNVKSYNTVSLPDSVTQILINYARNKNLEYQLVLRNSFMFKTLYNERLPVVDRLFACRHYITANSGIESYVPVFFLKQLELALAARQ